MAAGLTNLVELRKGATSIVYKVDSLIVVKCPTVRQLSASRSNVYELLSRLGGQSRGLKLFSN